MRENLIDVNWKDDNGWNVLHEAARHNRPEIPRWLLEETSIDINAQTNYGCFTALHLAVLNNRVEITRMLLEHNALLLKNNSGRTALDEARQYLDEEVIKGINIHYDDISIIIDLLKSHYNIR